MFLPLVYSATRKSFAPLHRACTMKYHISFALYLSALSGIAIAQDKPPTVADVQALQKKFQEERAEALEKKFPASSLGGADEQAKRADEATKAGNLPAALRMIREARWQVPYVPTDLPPNIVVLRHLIAG